jgi:threonine aldolase
MPVSNRRDFLRLSGLSIVPAILPSTAVFAKAQNNDELFADETRIDLFGDGRSYSPGEYIDVLKQLNAAAPIERDGYGSGGAVAALEKKFETITGKEKAIFMPSGTMANQLAIAVLSGENTKVFVQDLSHVYRDEADAAQSVFEKRLMPLAMGQTYFTADMLKEAIDSLGNLEVFRSGIGAVSIENPVRRADGRLVPLEEIKKISAYCRTNNIKLHLDGARIYMSAAWEGVSIKEYASYFDTIYISLYKYLGAAAGAVLCGEKTVIARMPHLMKIHGGNMYSNWSNAAMASHRLESIDERMKSVVSRSAEIFAALNKLPGIRIIALDGGTNIYELQLGKEIDGRKLQAVLRNDHFIRMSGPDKNNRIMITANETLLSRDVAAVVAAFKKALG